MNQCYFIEPTVRELQVTGTIFHVIALLVACLPLDEKKEQKYTLKITINVLETS